MSALLSGGKMLDIVATISATTPGSGEGEDISCLFAKKNNEEKRSKS